MLTPKDSLDLDPFMRRQYEANLASEGLQAAISLGIIDRERALTLNFLERTNLESEGVQSAVLGGVIDLETALKLTPKRRETLSCSALHGAIALSLLKFDQACCLTAREHENFTSLFGQAITMRLSQSPIISLAQRQAIGRSLCRVTPEERFFLEFPEILTAMSTGRISIEEAFSLTYDDYLALKEPAKSPKSASVFFPKVDAAFTGFDFVRK